MRKFQIVSLSQYGFPQAALADDLVREHLTRRRGGKRGKRTAKQKGAPPRPPTEAQAPRPGEGGRRGGARDRLGKAANWRSQVLDKATRKQTCSASWQPLPAACRKKPPVLNPKNQRKYTPGDTGIVAVILGAPPCLNWRNWRPQANPDLIEARRARFRIPDTIPTRRATPMPLHLNKYKEKQQEKTGS